MNIESVKHILIPLVSNFRYKLRVKYNIYQELKWLNKVILEMNTNLDDLYKNNIKNSIVYNDNCSIIEQISKEINSINSSLSIKKVSYLGSYIIGIKISKIRLSIIRIIETIGSCCASNIIKLYTNTNFYDIYDNNDPTYTSLFLIDQYYKPTNLEIYELKDFDFKNNNSFKMENNINSDLGGIFKFSKLNSLYKNTLYMKISGCKIYIPCGEKLIVLSGYFKINNSTHLLDFYSMFKQKKTKISNRISKLKINKAFKLNYIKILNILDMFVLNIEEIVQICIDRYNDLKKIRNKNTSALIKDFINSDIEKQRDIIINLLLNSNDTDNLFIIDILLDLLNDNKKSSIAKHKDIIIDTLNWETKKIINNIKLQSQIVTNNLIKVGDDVIPLEKRILLLKASNQIKVKAFDKLKEINSSKGGENNAKAIQYIEGLLKIPFGIYKEEPIMTKINQCRDNLIRLLDSFSNIKNNDTGTFKNLYKNDIEKINLEITKELQTYNIVDIKNNLNSIKNKDLHLILNKLSLSKKGVKKDLVSRIVKNFDQLSLEDKFKHSLISQTYSHDVYREYFDYINNWNSYKIKIKDYLKEVDNTLENSVYGMKEAKREIKRIIAQWINGNNKGYVFGFEGPPGTGKTTLAKKGISNCLLDKDSKNRPFCFIPLGGSTNGSTLEGHNYTYVGSTWGRIVESLMESECMNPIIYIDELDKISKTEHGKEIIGILVHLTDPSQNEEFMDKYFSGIKIDLSKTLIIFSYNDVEAIDKILLDRIHRIKIKSLNKYDKTNIVYKFLIPQICDEVGINRSDIKIEEETIFYIINNYTYEAGVRKLKECLYDLIRDINLNSLFDNNHQYPVTIDIPLIKKIFYEKNTVFIKKIADKPSIGIVNGLYATNNGTGGITTIETYKYLSDQRLMLELTGQQGDIMKESMKVAKTISWNLLPESIKKNIREEQPFGIHIHCPEAAMPKDGPSAGVGITIALISLLSNIPVNNKIAVTGEIDLNGNVLPIGGLDSKIEGAISANVEKVICPKKNIEDITKIKNSEFYQKIEKSDNFEIIMVENIFEAIDLMLVGSDKYKFSSILNEYYNLNLSCEEYLLMFRNLCDQSEELICITDTSDEFKLLYSSRKFNDLFGSNLLDTSLIKLIDLEYRETISKILKDTKINNAQNCARVKCTYHHQTYVMLVRPRKVDNIISCSIKLIINDDAQIND